MNILSILPAALLAALLAAAAATAETPAAPAASPKPGAHAGGAAPDHGATHHGAAHHATPHHRAAPVVSPPANGHAQKPQPARPGTGGKEAPKPADAAAAPPAEAAAEPAPAAPPEPPKGTNTGLPLPRWASLKSDDVNLRKGPGTRYPIEWVYRRHDLPVQIQREYEVWRLVEDQDGVKGWVHQANLTGRRNFVVKGGERALHRSASEDATVVARLRPGVLGRIRACEARAAWCEVQVGEYRGWLKREDMFGVYAGEAVN